MSIQHKDIAAIRQDYVLGNLSESDVDHDPIHQFKNGLMRLLIVR
ncbi:hypothetical protein [Sphingobacterium sp. E70]|nr:hypothetical protein [Sphingobacterium sp. E70]